MQGNTPVMPLVDAGCNMVIVLHLGDGSLWDRRALLDTTVLEIRPRKKLKQTGKEGESGGLLSFTSAHIDTRRQQGHEDTMLAMERIRKPLEACQALARLETVLQKSLERTEEADLALRNAMARTKQRRPKETPSSTVVFFLAGIIESTFKHILPGRWLRLIYLILGKKL